jgi:hypothetical protein
MDGGGADRRTGLDGVVVVLKVQGGRVSGGVTFHTDYSAVFTFKEFLRDKL